MVNSQEIPFNKERNGKVKGTQQGTNHGKFKNKKRTEKLNHINHSIKWFVNESKQ
jgi:hypothetical protein